MFLRKILWAILGFFYVWVIKPILFLFDAEAVHGFFTALGEDLGNIWLFRIIAKILFKAKNKSLVQEIRGIKFENPIGLSAGFDYEARLTQILPALGFGFQTVGTITNSAYEGNPSPRLGRLPKSRSLLVNKGFKNEGVKKVIEKLKGMKFRIPVGVSIGKTNSEKILTQKEAIEDIQKAFETVERANLPFKYYELNISCPNLKGNVEFYAPEHLRELLSALFSAKISKPVFIKMPIEKSDEETERMLEVISEFPVAGVIFGNLLRDRGDLSFNREEIIKAGKGNFSGKPTWRRSNELIALTYKKYGGKFVIVGCGGVFSAEDAYKKIRLGASLVQMITGMIFEGPQIVSQINAGLAKLLKRDRFSNIREAIGADFK